MFRNLMCAWVVLFSFFSNLLLAVDYQIDDIGTLNTKESHPIAINNKGQILGWYNIDGSVNGKHFFLRDKDGSFHEIINFANGHLPNVNWRFLTDEGQVYGTDDGNTDFAILYMWDQRNGTVKLGNLPGKEVTAVNNAGQVLIKSVKSIENGKTYIRPAIWQNGVVTKLKGLEGNIGIESEESYGLDMNNRGEVVGSSVVFLNYKNNIYKQTHAAKWVNGQALDLHREIPKCESTIATAINDIGDVLIRDYLIRKNEERISYYFFNKSRKSNKNYFFSDTHMIVADRNGKHFNVAGIVNGKLNQDYDSIWMNFLCVLGINDNGEIIAEGKTIFGETHIMLLTPNQLTQ